MKLRIHANSLRLRLSRSDVERLQQTGICTESLRFGSGSQLDYALEVSSEIKIAEASYSHDCIRVLLPPDIAEAWAASSEVSLSITHSDGEAPSVLIEKDFQCLHPDQENFTEADTFPNPAASKEPGKIT
jgi:hypothetical protein